MAEWRLELAEEARLYFQGRPVPVRRRGLAVLALIALGFEARRERIAAMLWEHGAALNNLRVELHGLRRYFPGWARGADPLPLPPGLEVRASSRPRLANLRGISPQLDAWIAELSQGEPEFAPSLSLPELKPPFVLFVRRLPLSDEEALVREVCRATGLMPGRGSRGLGVLRAGEDFEARTVLQNAQRSWLVFLPPYGEDPVDLLELRARLPAERVRYLELTPVPWGEARERWLRELPFVEAARIFLEAGGQPGHIAELLALRPARGFGARLPLPQRVRAVYRRESRFLSQAARLALERLSVHPGLLPVALVSALGLEGEVEELERRRWLVFRDHGWVFRHEAGRRVLAGGLEEGRRRLYHRRLAEAFESLGDGLAAAYHAREAGLAAPLPEGLPTWMRLVEGGRGRPLLPAPAYAGGELLIEGFEVVSGSPEVRGDRIAFVRSPGMLEPTVVAFDSPEVPSLLCLRGRAFVENPLGMGLDGAAYPLFLDTYGGRTVFAPVPEARVGEDLRVLPLDEAFELWLHLPPGQRLRLGTAATHAVIELELAFYRTADRGGKRVLAFAPAPVVVRSSSA